MLAQQFMKFVMNDLKKTLCFIKRLHAIQRLEAVFMDVADALIQGGKQTMLSFEIFEI